MSVAPASLQALRNYLREVTGNTEPGNFGIKATVSPRRNSGYHLGKSDIFGPGGLGTKDYSVHNPRDKAGLTEAAAAMDIKLLVKELKALRAHLVAEARAGRAPDLAEVLGPDDSGAARRWAESNGWQPQPARADHEWHIHVSWRRDSEARDKVALFRRHFEPDGDAVKPEDVLALQKALNAAGAQPRLVEDGIFGPATRAAILGLGPRFAALQTKVSAAESRASVLSSAGGYLLGDLDAAVTRYKGRVGA